MPYARPLTDDEADAGLGRVSGWTREGSSIRRTVKMPSFRIAVDLVNAVADAAEEADHHPDILIRWNRVTFTLSTHAVKALTQRDLDMAARIDGLVDERSGIESPGR